MPADANHYLEETDANRYLHDDDDEPAAQQVDANHYLDEPGPTAEKAGLVGALKTALSHNPSADAVEFAREHPGQALSIGGGMGLTAATAGLGAVPAIGAGIAGGLGLDVGSRYLEGDPKPLHVGEYGRNAATSMLMGVLAAALTRKYGKLAQYAGSVLAGEATNRLLGGEAWDKLGTAMNLAMPGLYSAVRSTHRGTRPGAETTRQRYGDQAVEHAMSIEDIQPIPAEGPLLKPEQVAPQIMDNHWKEYFERPAAMAMDATNEWVRDLGNRLHHFPLKGRHVTHALNQLEANATRNPGDAIDMNGSTLVQAGHLTPDYVNPETAAHAEGMRDFWGATGRLGARAGHFDADAPVLPEYFGPLVEKGQAEAALNPQQNPITAAQMLAPTGGSRKDLGPYARRKRFDPDFHETDQSKLIRLWRMKNEPGIKAALVFGKKPKAGSGQAIGEFGEIANDRIARILEDKRNGLLSSRDERAFNEVVTSLKRIYHNQPPTAWDRLFGHIGYGLSNVLLARSAPRQIGQAATNIAHVGVGNTIEGVIRGIRDPDYIPFLESGGAGGSSMAEHVAGMSTRSRPQTITGQGMSAIERVLRTWAAAGSQPYYEQTMAEGQRYAGAGKALPAGLQRQMREMDIDPTGPYTPSASGARDAHTRLTSDMQLLANEVGQSSDAMVGTPTGRTLTQFLPYVLGAAGLAREHYGRPFLKGLQGDRSEMRVASDRLGRLIPAAALTEMAGRGIYDAMSGNVPLSNDEGEQDKYVDALPGQIAERALQTHLGVGASVGSDFLRGFGHAPADEEKDTWGNLGWRGAKGVASAIGGFEPPVAEIGVHQDPTKMASMALSLYAPRVAAGLSLASPLLNKLGQAATAESADIPQMERPQGYVGSPMPENYGEAAPSPEPSYMPGVTTLERPPVSDFMGPPEPPPEERYLYGVYNYPQ